jgi:hypothetical protein
MKTMDGEGEDSAASGNALSFEMQSSGSQFAQLLFLIEPYLCCPYEFK